jgi:hypothetical protein
VRLTGLLFFSIKGPRVTTDTPQTTEKGVSEAELAHLRKSSGRCIWCMWITQKSNCAISHVVFENAQAQMFSMEKGGPKKSAAKGYTSYIFGVGSVGFGQTPIHACVRALYIHIYKTSRPPVTRSCTPVTSYTCQNRPIFNRSV